MGIKIILLTVYMLIVCVFGESFRIKCKSLEHYSENCLKYTSTFYKIISTGKENLRNKWEKRSDIFNTNPIVPQNQYQSRFSSSNSLKQNAEDKKNFFVITAIFNPASYQSRLNLYHNFVRHMNDTGAQLVTIECIFPFLNQTEFQVTEPNNPWHIQLKSESVYWMKENLINIAVSRLPPHAKWICWLDADIEFENKNWLELTIKELQKYLIVQMFEKAHFLGPAPENEILRTDYSFGYSVVFNKTISTKNYKNWFPHPGYGWAMAVEDFRKINGLPGYIITGSGDHLFAYSLIKTKSYPFGHYQDELQTEYKNMIAEKLNLTFSKLRGLVQSSNKEVVGYVPATMLHYWHGSKANRQYFERWRILADLKFNFHNDVTVCDNGLFQFNPNKPDLQNRFVQFFESRHEDLNKTDTADTLTHVPYKKRSMSKHL